MDCSGWIGYCEVEDCDNVNPIGALYPVDTIDELSNISEVYDSASNSYKAEVIYFVFYATSDCYDGGYTDENSVLKTTVTEFIDDNFPFVDGYIPKETVDGVDPIGTDIREIIYIPRAEYIHEFNPTYTITDQIIQFPNFLTNAWIGYCLTLDCANEATVKPKYLGGIPLLPELETSYDGEVIYFALYTTNNDYDTTTGVERLTLEVRDYLYDHFPWYY